MWLGSILSLRSLDFNFLKMKGVIILSDKKYLNFETIKRILASSEEDYSCDLSEAITVALKDSAHYTADDKTLEEWKNSNTDWGKAAYIIQTGIRRDSFDIICTMSESRGEYTPIIFEYTKEIPFYLIKELLTFENEKIAYAVARWCKNKIIPRDEVKEWLKSSNPVLRTAGLYANIGKKLPNPDYDSWVDFVTNPEILNALSVYFKNTRKLNWCILDNWYIESTEVSIRVLIMDVVGIRRGGVALLSRGLKDDSVHVRDSASRAFYRKRISLARIGCFRKSNSFLSAKRVASMYALARHKNAPIKWLVDGLKDANSDVVAAARFASSQLGLPPFKVVEIDENVYKKCLGDVIVIAEIPKDAETRGNQGKYCRSNKAKIVDIIGDFYGEKIGISCYNNDVRYQIGDYVKIPDFDFHENRFFVPGFYFFLTFLEAKGTSSYTL